MASLITIRLETDNNVNIKVVGADRKTIKMLSFSRAAYSIVKQKYIEDSELNADYNLSRSGVYILINDDGNTIYIGLIIHGYGSSGVGGAIKAAVRKCLGESSMCGIVRTFVPGENWYYQKREMLSICKDLSNYERKISGNDGITVVILK